MTNPFGSFLDPSHKGKEKKNESFEVSYCKDVLPEPSLFGVNGEPATK